MSTAVRVVTGYNPIRNGMGYGACPSPAAGLGTIPWGSIFASTLQAGVAVGTLAYQDKLRRDAEKKAEHEAARQRQHQLDLQRIAAAQAEQARQDAAAAAELQNTLAHNATGGAVAVDAHGNPIPASGIIPGMRALAGGSKTILLVGALGVGTIAAIALWRRRR